jgi:hypothetical protein
MKLGHWIAVGATLYLVAAGIMEFIPASSNVPTLPDIGSLTIPQGIGGANATTVAGALDLGAAAAIYFLVLHKRVMG